jgi:hypothetical protein
MLTMVAGTHCVSGRVLLPSALAAANLANLDLSDAALVCLSYFDCKTPARIQYAARRAKSKAPDAKLMLGLWTATDSALEATRTLLARAYPRRSRLLATSTGKDQ